MMEIMLFNSHMQMPAVDEGHCLFQMEHFRVQGHMLVSETSDYAPVLISAVDLSITLLYVRHTGSYL